MSEKQKWRHAEISSRKKGLRESARESTSRAASVGAGILDAGDHEAGWQRVVESRLCMPRGHMIAPSHYTRRVDIWLE